MIVNGKAFSWEGGSFAPNRSKALARNLKRWSSKEPMGAARVFVGFNVGETPTYKLSDLVPIVREVREEQTGDPSSSFVAQRGIYRHETGDVIEAYKLVEMTPEL